MSREQIIAAALAVAGAVLTTFIVRALLKVGPLMKRTGEFLDDWYGEPPRPGFEGRRGVMARIEGIEHETQFNSGQSLKDKTAQALVIAQRVEHGQEVVAQALRTHGIDIPDLRGGA